MVFFLFHIRSFPALFPALLGLLLCLCLVQLSFASELQSEDESGPEFCANVARELAGDNFPKDNGHDETDVMIAEFLALDFNPQRYFGGCFNVTHEPIPIDAPVKNGATESLRSALKAFGLSIKRKVSSSVTSLLDLYHQATSMTTELSFVLFEWADWNFLRDSLANGSLAVVAFQSANETPVDGYINNISHTRYALVSGIDTRFMYLTDPRSDVLNNIDRREFFFDRWKSRDRKYGTNGICSRCGLLVKRGGTVMGQKFLQRPPRCPTSEALP